MQSRVCYQDLSWIGNMESHHCVKLPCNAAVIGFCAAMLRLQS